jgi:hypothetical protein
MKYKRIALGEASAEQFDQLRQRCGVSTDKELLEVMLRYFAHTQADPTQPNEGTAAAAIKRLDDRVIGFIKEQEKRYMKPIANELASLRSDHQQAVTLLRGDITRTVQEGIQEAYLEPSYRKRYLEAKARKAQQEGGGGGR